MVLYYCPLVWLVVIEGVQAVDVVLLLVGGARAGKMGRRML